MEHWVLGLFSIFVLLVLVILRIHVALALALIGFIGQWLVIGRFESALNVLVTTPYWTVAKYTLIVMPMFILMGVFAGHAGFAQDAYDALQKWLGRLPGGLALATIAANAVFGAASGSSAAACAVFTQFSFPQMKKYKYDPGFACASIAAAGVLAMLIPPSVLMIVFGMITQTSVGRLFIGGFVPGILLTILYMIGIIVWLRFRPALAPLAPPGESWKNRFAALPQIWGLVFIAIFVLGGIYGGVFTPEEAGGAGAFLVFVLGIAMRRINFKRTLETLRDAARMSAMVFFVVIGAQIYSKFILTSGLPAIVIDKTMASGLPDLAIIGIFIGMYLVLGCFLDSISMMLVTIPVLYPISQALGWDVVWFGIVSIMAIEAGLLTPPLGIDVYVVKAAVGEEVGLMEIFKKVVPLFFIVLVAITIVVLFPSLATWLPGLMM
ncbi:TRAP transporter large permease [Chloroflexota bacterium]